MDAKVYRAATVGSWEELNSEPWGDQLTPIGNTVLHVYVGSTLKRRNMNIEFIKNVLDQEAQWGTRSPLWLENDNGDIPLHLAARFGRLKAVEEFLRRAKVVNNDELRRMLMKTNKRNDTALHEAARGGYSRIVKLLAEADPSCLYEANDAKETPLYLAAERGCADCVTAILDTCVPSAVAYDHKGPCGRTALHVFVQWKQSDMVSKILDKDESLIRFQDDEGSTPLHHAAAENKPELLQVLLRYDKTTESAAYIRDNEGRTPLHIATLNFSWENILALIGHRPDCIEIVDKKGQNVVHYAAKYWACIKKLEFLLKLQNVRKLMNEKDLDGNTPLHLVAASMPHITCHCIYQVIRFIDSQEQYANLFNNQNLTAGDIVASYDFSERLYVAQPRKSMRLAKQKLPMCGRIAKKSKSEDARTTAKHELEKRVTLLTAAAPTQLVVAALVATVSFTAGFTIPGGFNQNPGPDIGTAVFTEKSAFKAFLICDALAFTLSSLAVLQYFRAASATLLTTIERQLRFAKLYCVYSIGAMMVAFITGVYAVIPHSPRIQAALLFISAFFFVFYAGSLLAAPLQSFMVHYRSCPGPRIPHAVRAAKRRGIRFIHM